MFLWVTCEIIEEINSVDASDSNGVIWASKKIAEQVFLSWPSVKCFNKGNNEKVYLDKI